MKKFNKIGKINTLYRIIAGILVFTIALLAYSEMKEVKADGYITSTSVLVSSSGERSLTMGASAGSVYVGVDAFNGFEFYSCEPSASTQQGNQFWFNVDGKSVGSTQTYVIKYVKDNGPEELADTAVINVSVTRTRATNRVTLTPKYSNRLLNGLDDYGEKKAENLVDISATGPTGPALFTVKKDGEYIDPTSRPLKPGQYEVEATINENDMYDAGSGSTTFTISKYSPTLTISNVNPGEEPQPIYSVARGGEIVDCSNGMGMEYGANVMYKGENDSDYNEVVPTAAGTYSAKIFYSSELEELNNPASTTFTISLKEGKGKVTVADTVYGESSVKPKAESDTNDADKAEFFYKVKNTDDSTYIKDRPTKPGNYVCKAVFPKTGDYDKCEATCIFTIDRGKGVGSLTASDVYVGMEPKTTPTSATNGTTAVKYYYKEKSEDSSKYTDKVPTKPGEYTVKAVFPMTDYYYETSAEANFKTSYMPAPTFGLSGSQGKNNFYTNTVTIKAPSGYEVSLSYGKDYKDSINILDGVKYVYFKDKATGALSDKAAVPSYKMDSVLPVVKGVKNNDTIFKDEYELEVTDDYLEMVKVNDQTIPVKDGKATYKLTSDSGEMLYKIEATDQAGHTVTYTITVASPWVENGVIPFGMPVRLTPGKGYSIPAGKEFTIDGDDTVYVGGNKVYVDKEVNITFTEK